MISGKFSLMFNNRIDPISGFTTVELLIISLLLSAVVIFIIPGCAKKNDISFRKQTYENLKIIKAALERYAVDHNGEYPQFLIGGDKRGWDPVSGCDAITKRPPFKENIRQTNYKGGGARPPLDPLIAGGYLDSYPVNPFVGNRGIEILELTGGIGAKPGSGDVRFGFDGTKMGNVVDDPRFLWDVYPVFDQPDKMRLQPTRLVNTFSPDAYEKQISSIHPRNKINPFYSMGGIPLDDSPYESELRWIPGQFLYRASGEMVLKEDVNPEKLRDGGRLNIWDFRVVKFDKFILAAYGSTEKGGNVDIVRITTIERKVINNHSGMITDTYQRSPLAPYGETVAVFMSTPEVFGGGLYEYAPIFPYYRELDNVKCFEYGAPDGFPDGIMEPVFIDD
jgi:competence protein ComGC